MLRMLLGAAQLVAAASVAQAAAEALPERLVCRGNEPSWTLRLAGPDATWTTPELPAGQPLRGRVTRAEWARPALLAWRGSAAGEGLIVALVTREACDDTMADARFEYRARLSMPDGSLRVGCCSVEPRAAAAVPGSAADAAALSPPTPNPAPAPAPAPAIAPAHPTTPPPAPAAAPATPAPRPAPPPDPPAGRVVALALADGTICRADGIGPALAFGERRVRFACPAATDGSRTVLLGRPEPEGTGFRAARAVVRQRDDRFVLEDEAVASVRVAELETAGGRLCVAPPQGPRIPLTGERAPITFSCGRDGVDLVVLLGDPEPVAGGLAITQATLEREGGAYVVRQRERVRVAVPER